MKRLISFIITFIFFGAIFCFVLLSEHQNATHESAISNEMEQDGQGNYIHEPIAEQNYYQYNALNDLEKTIYDELNRAVRKFDESVQLNSYHCSGDMVVKVYAALMADYPQYFFLTKNCSYVYDPNKQSVKKILLTYTDGTTTDQYDAKGNRVSTANRTVITDKIHTFDSMISEVIKRIPTNSSELEKEKIIYKFIQSHVTYDMQAAALVDDPNGIQVPHAYDVYGAMCEKNAVCEGYAKLFQYLCYCVGINSTVVLGTSSGDPHMWNCVEIDSKWYMLDVTWDDCGKDNLYCYRYFNLTESQMSENHSADYSVLKVPSCISKTD